MNASFKKNNFMIGAAILVVILIVLSGAYYAISFFGEEKDDEIEEIEIEIIDDQISPLVTQGLTLEINRMRHRGLIEKILKSGNSWKAQPLIYYEITIDDLEEFTNKEAAVHIWDTIGKENRIMKNVDQEQESSEITIKIFEEKNTGLLGLKTSNILHEEIHVTYDYRTGRWTGDDFLMDKDGLGHYRGDTIEIWFNIYQTDKDGDYIPYWIEQNVLKTDPRVSDLDRDPDSDGIPTSWEWRWGYDPFTWDNHEILDPDIDGIQNIEEYQMEKYFANPYQQDIYIETDGMVKGGLFDITHVWYEESNQIVIERFASNGINVYIDNGWNTGLTNSGGELLSHYNNLDQDIGVMLQFYDHNFDDSRKGIFRYMIIGHKGGFCIPSEFNRYDTIVIRSSPNSNIKILAVTPRTQRIALAAAAMHEIGHSLGVTPWTFQGNDNISFNYGRAEKQRYDNTWGDYYSVMNYRYIWDFKCADYSNGDDSTPYDQNDWEHFYLPTFYIDVNAREDPLIEPPGTDRITNVNLTPVNEYWMFEENLTDNNLMELKKMCYVQNVEYDINVYVPINSSIADSTVKDVLVYAKPDTGSTYSEWNLIAEGNLNEEGEIEFYSQQKLIDEIDY
jgi:hypothetical protein